MFKIFFSSTNTKSDKSDVKTNKSKIQSSKIQSSKIQTSKIQTSKIQTSKIQTSKIQTSKIQPSKIQPSKSQPSKSQPSKSQPSKPKLSISERTKTIQVPLLHSSKTKIMDYARLKYESEILKKQLANRLFLQDQIINRLYLQQKEIMQIIDHYKSINKYLQNKINILKNKSTESHFKCKKKITELEALIKINRKITKAKLIELNIT